MTMAFLRSTNLLDNLSLMPLGSSSGSKPRLGVVIIALDKGLGGERPCSFLALTKTVMVDEGLRSVMSKVSNGTSGIVIQWVGDETR
jgi:hypothetical protein